MLLFEIQVWTDNSKGILTLAVGFSIQRSIGRSQYEVDVGDGNPGMDRKLKENIEFGCGMLIQNQVLEAPIRSGCW